MTSPTACPSSEELVRVSLAGDRSLEAHLATCATCRAAWRAQASLRELAAELPDAPPGQPAAERARLLARAATAQHGSRQRSIGFGVSAGVAAVFAAAVIATVVVRDRPTSRATLHPHGRTEVVQLAALPNEIVRLIDGTLTVEVEKLVGDERFRIVTGDAEVEVRGTAFDVVAANDLLQSVRVLHGVVEVRVGASAAVLLHAGERWTRPPPAPVEGPSIAAAATDVPRPVPEPTGDRGVVGPRVGARIERPAIDEPERPVETDRPVPESGRDLSAQTVVESQGSEPKRTPSMTPDEAAYAEAWDALRGDDPRAAADAFAKVLSDPRGELHEDASFWRAVALARAKARSARAAFEEFIDEYPSSSRVGEASVALGWILVGSRALDDAEIAFRRAADDPSPQVRESALDGLSAVASARSR